MRGVDATVKFATSAPDGVKRSSGSAVRFPTTVMVVSPATRSSWDWRGACRARAYAAAPTRLVLVGAQHLRPQHRLVQAELTIELGHRLRLRGDVDHRVDALGVLEDLVGQPAAAPDVDLVDLATIAADDVEERLQRRLHRAFVKGGVEDDHDFVWTHGNLITSYGHLRPRSIRGRRVACVGNRTRVAEDVVSCEIAQLRCS